MTWRNSQSLLLAVLAIAVCRLPFGCADVAQPDPTPPTDQPPVDDPPLVDNPPPDDTPTPNGLDSDGDGFSDDDEVNALPGSDPMNPADTPLKPIDSDGDGCSDFDELNFVGFCDNDPMSEDFSPPPDADRSIELLLTIARQDIQPFDDELADTFLTEAAFLLQSTQFECPDIPADVRFTRDGPVTTFQLESAVVTTNAQLDAVFDIPADIKIVSSLMVCGSTVTNGNAQVVGCSTFGDSAIVIANTDPDVWTHEWGHVQGLAHRDDCPRNIMHSFEVATNAVNSLERNAFLSPSPVNPADIIPPPKLARTAPHALARSDGEDASLWLERVLTRKYRAGLPMEVADGLDADAVTRLGTMLAESRFKAHECNIVRAMGLAGDPSACELLIKRILEQTEEPSLEEVAALAESFLSLGRLVGGDHANRAVEFLIEGSDPATWVRRRIVWRFGQLDADAAPELLSRFAIMGLGASSDPRAANHLLRIQTAPQTREADNGAKRLRTDQLSDALARLGVAPHQPKRSPTPLRMP